MAYRETVPVKMARGGYMLLIVEGDIYQSTDGAGAEMEEIEITSIKWPGGGVVADKNIADWRQVKDGFSNAVGRRVSMEVCHEI